MAARLKAIRAVQTTVDLQLAVPAVEQLLFSLSGTLPCHEHQQQYHAVFNQLNSIKDAREQIVPNSNGARMQASTRPPSRCTAELASATQQRQWLGPHHAPHISSPQGQLYSSLPAEGGSDCHPLDHASSGASGSSAASSSKLDTAAAPPPDTLAVALDALRNSARVAQLTPAGIAKQLNKHIVGQGAAKRAVAVALRNRWRRHKLPQHIAEEITPKNILMVGPTGCGKTEIARRLAKLVEAPFVKVEATKFTELGFVGRDVDEIVKDLVEASLSLTRQRLTQAVREAAAPAVENMLLRELCGPEATPETFESFRSLYRTGDLDTATVHLDLDSLGESAAGTAGGGPAATGMVFPGGAHPMAAVASLFEQIRKQAESRGGKGGPRTPGKTRMRVHEAREVLLDAEVDRALTSDRVVREALRAAQQDGIVFIDEIDKVVDSTGRGTAGATSSNVSSEGVQRDLLPILEGSTVATKYGNVSTDHVLFIASGAFHNAKPSDMLAELQGRLPVRVELSGLTAEDFYRILTEPEHNMLKQQQVLLATEGVALSFTDGAVKAIAKAAEDANKLLDNIGARRLHTVLERVLADISFSAPEKVVAAQQQQQHLNGGETSSNTSRQLSSSNPAWQAEDAGVSSREQSAAAKTSSNRRSSTSSVSHIAADATGSSDEESQLSNTVAAPSSNSICIGSPPTSGRPDNAVTSRNDSISGSSQRSHADSQLLVHYVVTEDMVDSCMTEVLKHQDLSKYVL